ncbi:MAG: hypothetical protein WEB90_02530 [Gemmatimonadota bacterium]
MRRTFALLAILATSWPHIAALECVLAQPAAPAAQGSAPTSEQGGQEHGHGAHGHAGPALGSLGEAPATAAHHAGSHQGSGAGGAECDLVMACGLVMIRADAVASGPELPSPLTAARSTTLEAPLGAVLVADPPPPRRIA